jgi:phosphatidylinositol alpha 1,6-mannosyltransferase
MRIALITETFLPKLDGIVNTLLYLLDHLAKRNHTSVLFAPAGGPSRYANTPVITYPGHHFFLYPELQLVSPLVNIEADLDAFKPDLIHVINPVSLGLAGMHYARRHHIPVVASYHTDVPGFAVRWGWGLFKEPLWTYFREIHNRADLNLCPSRATQRELIGRGFKNVKLWGRGVDANRFNPGQFSRNWRFKLSGGLSSAPLVLYVGRLSPEKRIRWLRSLFEVAPNARLVIVGDGPERGALQKLFDGTPTVFTGALSGEALAQAYAAADIFAFPSANETLGNVVLEAMASGLPVVAPRSGGLLDHVVHRETGLLVDPESQTEFLESVRHLANHRSYAQQLGRAGRARVTSHSWETVLDGLLEDYASTLHGARSPRLQPSLSPSHLIAPEQH